MKNLRTIAPWLILVLLPISAAIAQTADQQAADELPNWVAAARCQYTPADAACIGSKKSGPETIDTNDETTVAHLPRRIPGPPGQARRQPMGYPQAYSGMWMPSPSGRHAAIGALIGFGLGAAVGAQGTGGARATLTFGVLGGLLGAAFGCMTPSFHVRSPYRRGPSPYDEDDLASNSGPSSRTSKPGSRTSTPPPPTAAPNPGPPETATAMNDRPPLSAETP